MINEGRWARGGRCVKTYRIRSACRVKLPNLCEEKIMVLFPRSARSRSNKSGVHGGEGMSEPR